ncbi:uncharacterized protein LOC127698355 [Mytilus californianus]|uniref:uncharacterized protein LOC127698355 n=1 Tax=Mytilus californianus TaxID=6549 RepID=UPI0022457E8E|nr:uncharacterized protein LOC127698355 [Mytilus californianus]
MLQSVLKIGLLKRCNQCLLNAVRNLNTEGHFMKTELQFLTHEDESNYLYVHAFSQMGFLLSSETRVLGPIALFPKTVLHWNVRSHEHINEESLALFPLLVPKLDLVIIGYGDRDNKVSNSVFTFLKSKKINVEILPTDVACSTFNFLNLERRYVAAALIPPRKDMDIKIKENNDEIVIGSTMPRNVRVDASDTDITIEKSKQLGGGNKIPSLQQRFRKFIQEDGETNEKETKDKNKTDNDKKS